MLRRPAQLELTVLGRALAAVLAGMAIGAAFLWVSHETAGRAPSAVVEAPE